MDVTDEDALLRLQALTDRVAQAQSRFLGGELAHLADEHRRLRSQARVRHAEGRREAAVGAEDTRGDVFEMVGMAGCGRRR